MIQVYNPTKVVESRIDSSLVKTGSNTADGVTYNVAWTGNGTFTITYSGTKTSNSSYATWPTDWIPCNTIASKIKITTTRQSSSNLLFYVNTLRGKASSYTRFLAEAGTSVYTLKKDDDLTAIRLNIDICGTTDTVFNETITIKIEYDQRMSRTASDYKTNGEMVLFPSTAEVHAVLNGDWTATIKHPIDEEGRWKYLIENNVIKMPSFYNGDQLFRIKNVSIQDSGVECEAEPIFLDSSSDCFLLDVRPTGVDGQTALKKMLSYNNKYSCSSDITTKATAYYCRKNFIEALNGDVENSFINRWGGEILYDNFKVVVNKRAGADNGVSLLYGKNIKVDGFSEEVEIRDIVTRLYPQAYNGVYMGVSQGTNGYVDSDLINNYPIIHTASIKFEDIKLEQDASEEDLAGDTDVTVCRDQTAIDKALKARCEEQFAAGIDKPSVTIEADMILLQNTEEYEELAVLETVTLGDTVHCKHSKLNITTDARVIELTYDCINKRTKDVVLGDFQKNYINTISSSVNKIESVVNSDGNVIAERISGFIDGTLASIRAQYDVSKKLDYVALLFENLDTTSSLYGALGIGTQGIMISKKRNSDNTGWVWTTAMTANGLIADTVVTGLLADKAGLNYWNLDTGKMKISGDISIGGANGSNGEIIIYNDAGKKMTQLNQEGFRFFNSSGSTIWTLNVAENSQYASLSDSKAITMFIPELFRISMGLTDFVNIVNKAYSYTTSAGTHTVQKGTHLGAPVYMDVSNAPLNFWSPRYSNGSGDSLAGSLACPYSNVMQFSFGNRIAYFEVYSLEASKYMQRWYDDSSVINGYLNVYGTISQNSDERLKENIETADVDALSVINGIQMYSYDWIESGEHVNLGFIAQQVKEVSDDLVNVNEHNDVQSIKLYDMISYLTKAVQELDARIKTLESEILELKGEAPTVSARKTNRKRWSPTQYTDEEKMAFIEAMNSDSEGIILDVDESEVI